MTGKPPTGVAVTDPSVTLELGAPAGWLDVGPEEVVQLVEAGDGWLVAEGAVWSAAIVEVEPAGEGGGAFRA